MYAVILAGGKGRRFWPFSRAGKPKQFLDISGEGTMLSLTFKRLAAFIPPERIFLSTVAEQVSLVRDELPELDPANVLVEPAGRNTAPALAVAAAMIHHRGGDEPILCCPADHLIGREAAFRELVTAAAEIASSHSVLVTFGIAPDRPATGYGYIETGERFDRCGNITFFKAKKFHEKPDRERASAYLRDGAFYWNSGIFCWRPTVYLEAWVRHLPDGERPLGRISDALGRDGAEKVITEQYPALPSISVDFGILEKADNVVVGPAELEWSDVGSWDALFDILPPDGTGNVGIGDMELVDAKGSLFFNPGGTTAAIGVEDIIVAAHGKVVLVCRRSQSQRVRELIDLLESKGKAELL